MPSEVSLLRSERAAHATIRGYLYQACLGAQRWLELGPEEVLLCEGDEDLDRRLLGGGGVSEQVKVSSDSLGLSNGVVRESLRNFLISYVALREQGETRRFLFTTTAPARRTRGLNLLAAWKNGERGPEVIAGVREVLARPEKEEKEERRAEIEKALASLDAAPDGWPGFLDAVEWTFEATELDGVRREIQKLLAERADARLLPAEGLTDRLIAAVFHASSQEEPRERVLTRQSLSDLLGDLREGLGRWVQSPEGRRLRAVFAEVRTIRDLLVDGTLDLPEGPSPGKLLSAAYEVIPFDEIGRREELALLESWCNGALRRSVLLLTGEGGSGKTRLLIEWCRRLRHQGWHAGFLRKDRGAGELDPLLEGAAPRLIVIDYAETRLGLVEALLEKVTLDRDRSDPKLRLVFLARRPGDWWDGLRRKGDAVEDLLLASEPRALSPLEQPEERERAFRMALLAFAGHLGRKAPTAPVLPVLTGPDFARVLYLHMAALAALEGERIESAQDALERTLEHERRFWRSRIDDLKMDGSRSEILKRAVEPAVAALTLVQGMAEEGRARDLLQRTQNLPSLPPDLFESLLGLLKTLYGGTESRRFLDPLQPDLLGEQLVVEWLGRDGSWLSKVIVAASPEERVAVLAVLVRLAQRRSEARRWLEGALQSHLEGLAEAAVLVAVTEGDLLGTILAASLSESSLEDTAKAVMDLCDRDEFWTSVHLREVAFVATEKTLSFARARGDTSEQGQRELARVVNTLGYRLSGLGQREEALRAAEEATALYRQLVQQNMDVFLPELAKSLNNLGKALSDLGRREEALQAIQEAASYQRRLAEQSSDAFLPDLAMSLNNLGNALSNLGRREEALRASQEAVSIRRELADQNPGAFIPDLAGSLNNMGSDLSEFGRREEALRASQEATNLYRQLAQQRPDAFLPYVAASLNNLGNRLGALGRWEEALCATQEAADLYQQLAQQRPDAFLPDLAAGLNNQGSMLGYLGRWREALRATETAVDIRRQLSAQRPDAFLPDLAMSLNNLGEVLSNLGRDEEALRTKEEALRSLSSLFVRYPGALFTRMERLFKAYLELLAKLGREPDEQLLSPIIDLIRERLPPPDSTSSG